MAPNRKLVVEVVGDASSLERTFRRSSAAATNFDRSLGKTTRGVIAGSGAFRGLGRSIAFASASFLGGVGLTAALKTSLGAASDLEEQVSKTDVVFGQSAKGVEAWAQTMATSFGISQRAALTTASTFGALFRPLGLTGSEAAKQSRQLTELGADLASFYNTDVQDALDAIQSGLVGQVRPLKRYGVQLTAARVQQDALNQTGKKSVKQLTEQDKAISRLRIIYKDTALAQGDFARTSRHLEQQLKIARANIEDLQASIGIALVPAINKVVTSFNDWLKQGDNQKQLVKDLKTAADALVGAFELVHKTFSELNSVTGSARNSLKLLLGVLVGYKALKIGGTLAGIASNMGLIGTKATTAKGEVAGLRGALTRLSTAGPFIVGVTIAIGILETPQYKKFHKEATDKLGPFGFIADSLPKILEDEVKRGQKLARMLGIVKDKAKQVQDVLPPAGALGPVGQEPAGALGPPVAPSLTKVGPSAAELREQRARLKAAREATRQEAVDRAGLAVDQASLTKSLADDLAALNKLNALLRRRIKGGHDTVALEQQLVQVQQQIIDVREQQREQAEKARDARQFKLLGFGPSGEDLIPGVGALKKQLASVTDVIAGSFLDTRKTRGLLAHIRQVLSGGLGSVSSEVRAKIQQILADLKAQLKQSSVDVTRFQKTATGQFALAGAHPAGRGVVINGGIHLHGVQNVQQLENELKKRDKQRAHARRSTR